MGCCQARDEKTSVALGINKQSQDLNETAGLEFPLNTSGAVDEDESYNRNKEKDGLAISTKTLEISDNESGSQSKVTPKFYEYQEVQVENMPFSVMNIDQDGGEYDARGSQSQPNLHDKRGSFASSNSDYQGIDQVEFFQNVIGYLQRKQAQDIRGGINSQEVDRKLDVALKQQIDFYLEMLRQNEYGAHVTKNKSADFLEHCLKGLMPIVRVSDSKFLFGTSVKVVQIRSEKLLVQSGGGFIPIEDHWRAVAVSETIKLNKLINTQRKPMSTIVKMLLESAQANANIIEDFMSEARFLNELFTQQSFLLKAWSKQQLKEQDARNHKKSPSKKKKKISGVAGAGSSPNIQKVKLKPFNSMINGSGSSSPQRI